MVRSITVKLEADTSYSLFHVGGPAAGFVEVIDENAAPATLGKAKVSLAVRKNS